MTDPFAAAVAERRLQLMFGLILLLALIVGTVFLSRQTQVSEGPEVDARVVRFGSYSTDVGDRPLVVVQLADGSIHQLMAARSILRECRVGSRISLVRTGAGLQVGIRGCD